MWTVIKQTPQFIASDLYVTVEVVGFHVSASSQHGNGVKAPHSSLLDVQPFFTDAMPLPYNKQPCSAVDDVDKTEVLGATHTHDVGGSSHTYKHVQADMDGGIDIDASRDMYKEFIDTDGVVDDAEALDVPLIENNEKDCLTTIPILEWFISNTWDNIKDPSPALGTGHLTSWHKGDHPGIGMLFKNKASVHKKHGLWQISKCTGPHSCSSLQVATDRQMMNSKFISIALEEYVREDLTRKVSSYFDECRNKTLEQLEEGQVWCKYAYDKFEANQEKAKLHRVKQMSAQQQLYTMETQSSLLNTARGDHTYRISLMDMTCTCGKWEANKIPCSHLIVVCAKHNHDATEYMDCFYRVEERYHSYELIFQPFKDRLEWPEPEERRTMMPNLRLIREKGQPTSTRIRNEMDDEDRELPTSLWIENEPNLKCGLGRQEGHNRHTCSTRSVASTSRGAT
nr:hypothetical protein CFP56_56865 [Quercus suber]